MAQFHMRIHEEGHVSLGREDFTECLAAYVVDSSDAKATHTPESEDATQAARCHIEGYASVSCEVASRRRRASGRLATGIVWYHRYRAQKVSVSRPGLKRITGIVRVITGR